MMTILVVAISIAALRAGSKMGASIAFSSAIVLNLTAALLAACGHGRGRARWAGFTAFGLTYLTLAFGPWFHAEVKPHLLTTKWFIRQVP
jgi:hypothetical protein